ncbi:MAG: CD225/dispanin family protein [Frankia sp.]|nr:CD225/dispanin family protein [Frankia sp.]
MSTPPPYGAPGPYGQPYPPPGGGFGPPPGGGYGPPPGQPIPNYLVQSILATLFCCMPTGIAAIVFSTRVQPKQAMGDIHGALEASKKARQWCIISVVLALLYYLFWVLLVVFVIAASD